MIVPTVLYINNHKRNDGHYHVGLGRRCAKCSCASMLSDLCAAGELPVALGSLELPFLMSASHPSPHMVIKCQCFYALTKDT